MESPRVSPSFPHNYWTWVIGRSCMWLAVAGSGWQWLAVAGSGWQWQTNGATVLNASVFVTASCFHPSVIFTN